MRRRKSADHVKRAADRAALRSEGKDPLAAAELTVPSALDPPDDPRGRPTEYKPEFVNVAIQVCARGGTMYELAEMLGVSRTTIYVWRATHQEFADAIKVAKDIADERVGFSLYERAVGYSYNAVKIMQHEGTPVMVPYVEHVPPDVGAQKHWLANRKPEQWREVSEQRLSVSDTFLELLRVVSGDKRVKVIEGRVA